jgi:hypothetical protein
MVIRYESASPSPTHATPNYHASKLVHTPARDPFIIANTGVRAPDHSEESANRWGGVGQSIRAQLLSVPLSDRAAPYHSTTPTPTPPVSGVGLGWVIRFPSCASLYGLVTHFERSNTLAPYDSRLFRREPVRISPYKSITWPCCLM